MGASARRVLTARSPAKRIASFGGPCRRPPGEPPKKRWRHQHQQGSVRQARGTVRPPPHKDSITNITRAVSTRREVRPARPHIKIASPASLGQCPPGERSAPPAPAKVTTHAIGAGRGVLPRMYQKLPRTRTPHGGGGEGELCCLHRKEARQQHGHDESRVAAAKARYEKCLRRKMSRQHHGHGESRVAAAKDRYERQSLRAVEAAKEIRELRVTRPHQAHRISSGRERCKRGVCAAAAAARARARERERERERARRELRAERPHPCEYPTADATPPRPPQPSSAPHRCARAALAERSSLWLCVQGWNMGCPTGEGRTHCASRAPRRSSRTWRGGPCRPLVARRQQQGRALHSNGRSVTHPHTRRSSHTLTRS